MSKLLWPLVAVALLSACGPRIEPGQAEIGEVGAACASAEDCTVTSDMTCLKMSADGYCASDCALLGQFACPDGSVCEQLGDQAVLCIDGCCSGEDCRPGFRCARRPELDVYQDLAVCAEPGVCLVACKADAACETGYRCDTASGECVPKKGANAGVGAACASADDCNSDTCLTSFPGGYCTSPCGTQLQGCEPGSDCYQLPSGSSTCMALCQASADCRSGYRCEEVSSGGDNSSVLAFCVPRCEGPSDCEDGFHCDASSGECVEGAAEPGPIGAFCEGNDDCLSGECRTSWPNGYCTTDCAGCAEGTCIGGVCTRACTSQADCRFGYVCQDAGCVPSCTADGDCAEGLVCNTVSGLCVSPAEDTVAVVDFGTATLEVTDQGSDFMTFTVPDNALSAVIHADDGREELMAIWQLYAPGDVLLYDITDPVSSRIVVLPTDGTFTAMIPPGPNINFVPGEYRVSFLREVGTATTDIRVFGKTAGGYPETQALDLVFTFVGNPEGLNASNAQGDADFQVAVTEFKNLYQALGITFGDVIYEDIASNADKFRVVDSVDGPGNELSQLFATSTDRGQALTFFFVEEIVGGDEGFTILGIAGGIPGPPLIAGGPHSGVAVTLLDFRSRPKVLGQTIAHEAAHFLGLFHTSEAGGNSHDPLPDTAECSAANDKNFDGYVSADECAGKGAENFMFWLASDKANKTSKEQGRVLLRNPGTK